MDGRPAAPAPHSVTYAPDSAPTAIRPFHFHGNGRDLLGIFIVNLFFTILTLGIYSFWAKTRTRRYLWGQIAFAGDHLAYH